MSSCNSPISSASSVVARPVDEIVRQSRPATARRLAAALLLAIALAAGAPFAAPVAALAETAGDVAPTIPAKAMAHILSRHGPDSTAPGAGKYAPGTTEETIRALIAEALSKGKAAADTQFRPAQLYDYSFPQVIGTTIDGKRTSRIRVVVGRDGAVVTAYPR
jgi:hypothetical protein